jgi:hypothetical protein
VKSYPERLADGADFRECCGTPADPALAMGHADHCAVAAQRAEENRARYADTEPDGADHAAGYEAYVFGYPAPAARSQAWQDCWEAAYAAEHGEPDGADDGTTGETVAVVETPRRPQ